MIGCSCGGCRSQGKGRTRRGAPGRHFDDRGLPDFPGQCRHRAMVRATAVSGSCFCPPYGSTRASAVPAASPCPTTCRNCRRSFSMRVDTATHSSRVPGRVNIAHKADVTRQGDQPGHVKGVFIRRAARQSRRVQCGQDQRSGIARRGATAHVLMCRIDDHGGDAFRKCRLPLDPRRGHGWCQRCTGACPCHPNVCRMRGNHS